MPESQNIDAGMALLAARFITRLAERQTRLQVAWSEWETSGGNTVPAVLIGELHSLAGAAPLFGHQQLGDQARALEQALRQVDARIENIAPAIAALLSCIAAVQSGPDQAV